MRRETILLLCFAFLGLLFVVTAFAVRSFHAQEKRLAWGWSVQGEENLRKAKPAAALLDFRTALLYAHGDPVCQLRLAQALIASGRLNEAQDYLLRLWEISPADGQLNLELAQVAMQKGNSSQVINYFHNAIGGVWQNASAARRRQMRQELCEYLIDHGRRTEGVAELMVLSQQAPGNPQVRTQVAELFLKAQDYDAALKEFRGSLALDSKQPAAWEGAGEAAFVMGDYRLARRYLQHALAQGSKNTEAARMLATADDVLRVDPLDRRVAVAVRRRRVILAFQRALKRLQGCAQSRGENLDASGPQTDFQQTYASAIEMKPQMQDRTLRRNPDLMDSSIDLVFHIERLTAQECGPPQGLDLALLLIAQHHGGAE